LYIPTATSISKEMNALVKEVCKKSYGLIRGEESSRIRIKCGGTGYIKMGRCKI
jgi:hypothetical protein